MRCLVRTELNSIRWFIIVWSKNICYPIKLTVLAVVCVNSIVHNTKLIQFIIAITLSSISWNLLILPNKKFGDDIRVPTNFKISLALAWDMKFREMYGSMCTHFVLSVLHKHDVWRYFRPKEVPPPPTTPISLYNLQIA